MPARAPTEDKRAFLDAVLSHSFDGVEALRDQWAHVRVQSNCDCGYGSIGFVFDDGYEPTRSTASSPLSVEDVILGDAEGEVVGRVLVFLRDGRLHDVDVHGGCPLPFPSMTSMLVVRS